MPIPEHQCGNRYSVVATVPLYPEFGTIYDKNEVPDAPYPIAQSPFVPTWSLPRPYVLGYHLLFVSDRWKLAD